MSPTIDERVPWHAWPLLLRPRRIRRRLRQLVAAGVIERAPNLWQVELGVLRMWLRVFFRSDTVGTCAHHPVRRTWRARLLRWRLLRGPFLAWERAVAPLDHSGLAQPEWRLVRHLLAAHHDQHAFAYDLEILKGTPGALEEVEAKAREVIAEETRRARWLRDLVVFDRYHESLLESVARARAGLPLVTADEADDPDIAFDAYARWCLAQPPTPRATFAAWRAGAFPAPLLPPPSSAHDDAA